jgi:hypothetical protein
MYIHIPVIDWLPIVGGPLLAAALFVAALSSAARRVRLPAKNSSAVILSVAAFVIVWFAAYACVAGQGMFTANPALPIPLLPIALLLPLIVAICAFQAVPTLRVLAEEIPQRQLIGIQIIRLMGFGFLLLLAQSLLPPVFALPAGLGDMFVGAEAILVAGLYARRAASASMMGLIWNLTGIVDFVVSMAIGFLASTTPLQLIHVSPSTDLITFLPLAMVPVFGIPIFLTLHALSLRRVIAELKVRTGAVAM